MRGEILVRVPARYLIRARAVCKSWRALIDEPSFRSRVPAFQTTMIPNTPRLDEGLELIQRGIDKLIFILQVHPEQQFSSEEYVSLYTIVYDMCTQKCPYDFSRQLYEKYREVFEQYITSTVLPCLRNLQGELLLRELVKRWQFHKKMVFWLSKIFRYLDRYYVHRNSLPSLSEVGLTCFRDMEMNGKARDAVSALEREGKQIDRALLKNVSDVFVDLGQIVSL